MVYACESKNAFIALKRILDKYGVLYEDDIFYYDHHESEWEITIPNNELYKPGLEAELDELCMEYIYDISED